MHPAREGGGVVAREERERGLEHGRGPWAGAMVKRRGCRAPAQDDLDEAIAAGEARGRTRGLYVDPPEYGTYAYATSDGRKRDPSEEPVKQSDHVFGATRCALHTELGEHAATEAYLAEMQEYVGLGRDERDALVGVLPS